MELIDNVEEIRKLQLAGEKIQSIKRDGQSHIWKDCSLYDDIDFTYRIYRRAPVSLLDEIPNTIPQLVKKLTESDDDLVIDRALLGDVIKELQNLRGYVLNQEPIFDYYKTAYKLCIEGAENEC